MSRELGKLLNTTFDGHPVYVNKYGSNDYIVTCKKAHFLYSTYVRYKHNKHIGNNNVLGRNIKGDPCALVELPNNRVEIGCLRDDVSAFRRILIEVNKYIKNG